MVEKQPVYQPCDVSRDEIDRTEGLIALEFGNGWCGYCRAASPHIDLVLHRRPEIRHIRIADSRECRIGRSFGVKLWPTIVFVRDGVEISRVVRPSDEEAVRAACP